MRNNVEYRGIEGDHDTLIIRVELKGGHEDVAPLNPRTDIRNHSPSGMSWGYMGSGPSQLALAILADHMKDDVKAEKYYMQFKAEVISKITDDAFVLSNEKVQTWINRHERLLANESKTADEVDAERKRATAELTAANKKGQ